MRDSWELGPAQTDKNHSNKEKKEPQKNNTEHVLLKSREVKYALFTDLARFLYIELFCKTLYSFKLLTTSK